MHFPSKLFHICPLSSFSGPNPGLHLYHSQPKPLQQLHPFSGCGLDTILCQEANSLLGTRDEGNVVPAPNDSQTQEMCTGSHCVSQIPLFPSERFTVLYGYPTGLHFPTSFGLRRGSVTKFLTKACAGSNECHVQVQDTRPISSSSPPLSGLARACIWCWPNFYHAVDGAQGNGRAMTWKDLGSWLTIRGRSHLLTVIWEGKINIHIT